MSCSTVQQAYLLHLTQVEQAAVDGGSLGQLLPDCAAAVTPLAACM